MNISRINALLRKQEGISNITEEEIKKLQLNKLNAVLARERERAGFYRDLPKTLESLEDLRGLPFTTANDLSEKGNLMLICSQGDVQKIITEKTSGSSGVGKRVFYTEGDIERTIDLFYAGLGEFIFPGDKTMICMPFTGPFGLGELIAAAIERIGATPLCVGCGKTYGELKAIMDEERPETYVGMPTALLSMLRILGKGSLKRALVSGDACPPAVMSEIENILGERLWPHYGSREMGLGGAICCEAHEGMHMRENNVIMEIVDERGETVPDGEWGELVITTIGMEAQPLIRYRTGDRTRIIPGPCPCGSCVKRLDRVTRMGMEEMEELDDLIFSIPEVVDYSIFNEGEGLGILALLTDEESSLKRMEAVLEGRLIEGKRIISKKTKRAGLTDGPLYQGKRIIRVRG